MPPVIYRHFEPVPTGVNPWAFIHGTAPGVPAMTMRVGINTVVTQFRVRVRQRNAAGRMSISWRTLRMVATVALNRMDDADHMTRAISTVIKDHLGAWAGYDGDDSPELALDSQGNPVVQWMGSTRALSPQDIATLTARGGTGDRADMAANQRDPHFLRGRRMHGVDPHRSFRYHIPGADVPTLQDILPKMYAEHAESCQRMCVYEMLRDRNPPRGNNRFKKMQPEAVHAWFRDNLHAPEVEPIGAITDGVTPEQLQKHAEAMGYPHAALDVTRSLLLLHYPEKPNANMKTICYTIVGDHAIPFTDPEAIDSIMTSAGMKLGKRRVNNLAYVNEQADIKNGNTPATNDSATTRGRTREATNHTPVRKRSRSVNRTFQVERQIGTTVDTETTQAHEIVDFELDEREEGWDIADHPDHLGEGTDISKRKRALVYPGLTDTHRFVTFSKEGEEGRTFVRQHLYPAYKHGDNHREVYYFICTDDVDIQFLYDYCIHVLKWDPTTACRSYNGLAYALCINNVVWRACPDWELIRSVHMAFQPNDPFRWSGLASYAMRLLVKQMNPGTSRHHSVWDCMSQYPPNLMRLLDTHHPYHRPMLSQHTYHAPYGIPEQQSEDAVVPVLIPEEERERMDMIRSYTSCLLAIDNENDSFPIHDVSNKLIPFVFELHRSIPVGHYLINVPDHATLRQRGTFEDWQRLPGFVRVGDGLSTDACKRMLTHRMVRALINRELLNPLTDIELVCIGDGSGLYPGRGRALSHALAELIRMIYQHPNIQEVNSPIPKRLINQLVGLCNGTTVPFSGMRLVFHDLQELWQLSLRIFSDDQLQNVHINRHVGTDVHWDVPYDYFEMCHTGISHRHFHLQPVFNMVLETQAIRLFDVCRPIPLYNLIQVNVDAVEYRVRANDRNQPWYNTLTNAAVVDADYVAMTPTQVLTGCMGRYKPEKPKSADKWRTYHYDYSKQKNETVINRIQLGAATTALNPETMRDPESQDYIPDWRSTLRIVEPGAMVREPDYIHECASEWMISGAREADRTGILLTGPAGTGKTHWIRELYRVACNLGAVTVRTAFTHSACMQMGPDAVTLSSLFGLDASSESRRIVCFSRKFLGNLRSLKIDILIIDEISMIPLYLLEVLCLFHRMHTSCRIVLSGDFRQLPPVEPGFDRPEGWSYFKESDIFDYLIMDRVTSKPGRWIRLTECMRTDDPLLQHICKNPDYVTTELNIDEFPVDQTHIWRFVCSTNRTRKACNTFCMLRWLDLHPDMERLSVNLPEVYADFRMAVVHPTSRFDRDFYIKECTEMLCRANREENITPANNNNTKAKWFPRHWSYLQNFVYTAGMDVVCRNTLREYKGKQVKQPTKNQTATEAMSQIVNNRRARIVEWDPTEKTVQIQWIDMLLALDHDPNFLVPDPITLSLYDFAFNFVPGFCITVHMSQGETIREHYGILDWGDIRSRPSMAYVAVTRPSHPKFLHIIPYYAPDPWDNRSTADPYHNAIKKLYTLSRMDYKEALSSTRVTMDHLFGYLALFKDPSLCLTCEACGLTPLRAKGYMETNPNVFSLDIRSNWWTDPQAQPFRITCGNCKPATNRSLGRSVGPPVASLLTPDSPVVTPPPL